MISLLALAVVSACSSGPGAGKPAAEPGKNAAQETTAALAPAELTITSSSALSEEAFESNFGQYLKKKFPNFKFTYIKKATGTLITDLITAGTPIDLIFESSGNIYPGLINAGLAMDISELIKKHNIDLNRFDQGSLGVMRQLAGGGLYGLPVNDLVMVTYYNKDIFDRFGVAYPKDGITWEETIDLAKKLTRNEDGKQYLGLVVSPAHYIRLNQLSIGAMDPKTEKATLNNEKWKLLFDSVFKAQGNMPDYMKYVTDNKNKMPYKDEFLKTKTLAMFVYLSDLHTANQEVMEQMNWNMATAPVFKDMPKTGTQTYPFFWNIASNSKNKDASMEVLKYLTSDEYQLVVSKRGEMTSLKNADIRKEMGKDMKFKNINYNAVYAHTPAASSPRHKFEQIAQKPAENVIADVVTDKVDVNSALRRIDDEANKALDAEKKK